MGDKDFKCSNGWLERFKKRHGVTSKSIIDESTAVNRDTVDVWHQHRLQALLEKYEDKEIYNLDEATFFYKMLLNHTLTIAGRSSSGGKQQGACHGAVWCQCNRRGQASLLILGKAEKLRCFQNATIPKGCIYRRNK
ncbi:hypothetical protein HPB49_004545 [Dermacentor silvarum]|uniref:Uncharacterized protein n=1 Tax=Dermacentor silvarum TaxID=543639 RepID=A0ACB8DAV0_DERSI|nr:hypothetical protein HPB49_004545 [Dermacentor silvarum]